MFSRATLAGNILPSHHTKHRAAELGRRIIQSIDSRQMIISDRQLDSKFGLPGANWEPGPHNDFLTAVERLRRLDWADLRHLRLMSQCFSGYSLREFRGAQGLPSYAPIPDDFDALWEDRDGSVEIQAWRSVVADVPDHARVKPPHMLGEIGWWVDGCIVNFDTFVYQERMTLLANAGVIESLRGLGRPARILEIGGGYGALALALRRAVPGCAYTICDLPESLMFSGLYLTMAGDEDIALYEDAAPEDGLITLVPNYLFEPLAKEYTCDLVINTLSMSEMTAHQIRTYCHGIAKMIGEAGVFFEQNQDNRHIGLEFASEIAADIFPHGTTLQSIGTTQGEPHIWSNVPFNPVV